ncbi:zinc finger protein weckle [Drosophila miranda]|uniref:zinc finger protein weckle n=1 Tax=Drosophila miranda TaxID=7229 RepID=UPI0007E72CCA|nr:zinc finger protein weckle [Drosophila miranda]
MTNHGAGGAVANASASAWHKWCRLCAKDHPQNANVYARNQQDQQSSWTSMLAMAIGKYFWVDIKVEDELSNHLCVECFMLMECLIEFSERVRRVQTLFSRLQSLSPDRYVDFEELRTDCGLLTDEWKHVMSRTVAPPRRLPEKVIELEVEEHFRVQEIMEEEEREMQEEQEQEQEQEVEEQEEFIEEEEHPDSMEEDMVEDCIDEDSDMIDESEGEEYKVDAYKEPSEEPPDDAEIVKIEREMGTESDAEDDPTPDHLDEKATTHSYKCDICRKTYKKPNAYKKHMLDVHNVMPDDLPNLECKQCGAIFPTVAQLQTHERTHLPAKEKADNSCPHCSKLFTTSATLKRHIDGIHNDIKPFICDICARGFNLLAALNDHKLVHTDECPFECPVCQRRFKNKARLRVHADTHSATIYECNICGLKLKTRRTFNKHKVVHSDKRQHKCEQCGAEFKRTKTLKSHLILHTGIRPYKCNFCDKDFSNGSNCRSHKRKAHPKELEEEESKGVTRSTILPVLEELAKASNRIKSPAKRFKRKPKSNGKASESPAKDTEGESEILYKLVGDL